MQFCLICKHVFETLNLNQQHPELVLFKKEALFYATISFNQKNFFSLKTNFEIFEYSNSIYYIYLKVVLPVNI